MAGSEGLECGYGRFLQTDPLGYDDGLNWYSYVKSDPINNYDPTGTDLECSDGRYFTASELTRFGDTPPCVGEVVALGRGEGHGGGGLGVAGLGGNGGADPGGGGGSGGGRPAATPAPVRQNHVVCKGRATFSAVGPLPQAAGDSAFAPGTRPANGTVAIAGAQTFGFDRRALRQGAAAEIQISPEGLDDVLRSTGGPLPPYTVGDYGDVNIRSAPGSRFDIYRFSTTKGALAFGKRTVLVTITVPAGGHCPPGTSSR